MIVAIIGHFGVGQVLRNGQTIKAQNLADGMKKYTTNDIKEIDTHGWGRHPFRLFRTVRCEAKRCDAMIMLPAQKGVRVFSPLLTRQKRRNQIKIYYDVIGGWLPDLLVKNQRLMKKLKSFDGTWVEVPSMKQRLNGMGLQNVTVVPNFHVLTPLKEEELVFQNTLPYKLCIFSRILLNKGIEDAIQAVSLVNEGKGYTIYKLDIYGQIDDKYEMRFKQILESAPDYINYCGCVDPSESVNILKNYFAMLFPTYYEGEGFAGTILDAFSAGIPVIATDWKYNEEVINNKVGYLFKTRDIKELERILSDLSENPDKVMAMKKDCLRESYKYDAKNIIGQIEQLMTN